MHVYRLVAIVVGILVLGNALSAADAKRPADDGSADLRRWQGTWTAIEVWTDGSKMDSDLFVKDFKLTIQGDEYTWRFRNFVTEQTIRLDPTTKPKSYDGVHKDGKVVRGIYQIDGDRLTLCSGGTQQDRPTEFTTKPDSKLKLVIYKRDK